MILEIDAGAVTPPYEQIRAQVATMIGAGVLTPGTRLPPIRQLAKDLGLASGTVARAYRELETQGLVATRGRHGTLVQAPPASATAAERELAEAARSFAIRARQLGADAGAAVQAARRAFDGLT
jgi:GntR family transcriptional regulator